MEPNDNILIFPPPKIEDPGTDKKNNGESTVVGILDNKLKEADKLRKKNTQDSIQKASRLYEDVLKVEPENFDALLNLGEMYLYDKYRDVKKATQLLNTALEIRPDSPVLNYNLGVLNGIQRNYKQAIVFQEKATRLDPKYAQAYLYLALCYEREEDMPKAKQTAELALKFLTDPDEILKMRSLLEKTSE